MKKKIAILGMFDVFVYAVSVALYMICKLDLLLTLWEVTTILSAPIMLLLLLNIMHKSNKVKSVFQNLTIVFMTSTIVLTSVAHFVNITVTRRLIANGVNIPKYLQIGYWPSVEMAIDYLAWGLFMGLAFIMTACSLCSAENTFKRLKTILLICGGLCQLGFFGTMFINENIWYLAPLGYGVGTIVVCVEVIRISNRLKNSWLSCNVDHV